MHINWILAGFSIAVGAIVVTSLFIGKTPYTGFFGRHFIARRKFEPGHYWSMLAQYLVVCAILAVAAVFAPGTDR